ncbi:MAG: ankyrin repeat domain-containing protein [Verrucomicrobia bacterium]|nr:ankyrin repeat domain-containing protein [Verrucomicrobiota bacterium]MBS0645537.1 ankyrin repeat domain-containing protein [Verrucomicrobiota bacterium]
MCSDVTNRLYYDGSHWNLLNEGEQRSRQQARETVKAIEQVRDRLLSAPEGANLEALEQACHQDLRQPYVYYDGAKWRQVGKGEERTREQAQQTLIAIDLIRQGKLMGGPPKELLGGIEVSCEEDLRNPYKLSEDVQGVILSQMSIRELKEIQDPKLHASAQLIITRKAKACIEEAYTALSAVDVDNSYDLSAYIQDWVGKLEEQGVASAAVIARLLEHPKIKDNAQAHFNLLVILVNLKDAFFQPKAFQEFKFVLSNLLKIMDQQHLNPNLTMEESGLRVLHYAALFGDLKTVKRLCGKGANPFLETAHGFSPLRLAVRAGFEKIVQFFLSEGVDIREKDRLLRETLLHVAAASSNPKVMKVLLDQRAIDVNARSAAKDQALHIAARRGDLQMVQLLLASGADPDLKDRFDCTSLELAKEKGYTAIVECLRQGG